MHSGVLQYEDRKQNLLSKLLFKSSVLQSKTFANSNKVLPHLNPSFLPVQRVIVILLPNVALSKQIHFHIGYGQGKELTLMLNQCPKAEPPKFSISGKS